MWFLQTLALSALFPLSNAAAIAPSKSSARVIPETDYDAIIVGGGPAGLSALSGLARVRRNVLLIDSGEYRNGPTRYMHDVIGFDGVQPAYYRWAARRQISDYPTVVMANGTVTDIKSQTDGKTDENTWFTVSVTNPDNPYWPDIEITARKIVLATGMRDILPSTPGIAKNWGKGIYWCPWCDGNEHANQTLGLLAPLDKVTEKVQLVRTLNTDIIAFVNGTDTSETRKSAAQGLSNWQGYLKLHNVTIDNRTITRVNRLRYAGIHHKDPSDPSVPEFDLFSVEFTEGDSVQCAAFLASFPEEQRSDVGKKAGVEVLDNHHLSVNQSDLMTNVPGIYAIGDANSDNSSNVPHALYSGKKLAVKLHVQLETEQQGFELSSLRSKRDTLLRERDLWDTVNGKRGELLYAGEFDQ